MILWQYYDDDDDYCHHHQKGFILWKKEDLFFVWNFGNSCLHPLRFITVSFEIRRPFFLSLRVEFSMLSQNRNGIFFVILVYARFTSNWLRAESATFPKRSLMKILRPRLENDKSIFCPSFVARWQTLGTFPQISVASFPYFEFQTAVAFSSSVF